MPRRATSHRVFPGDAKDLFFLVLLVSATAVSCAKPRPPGDSGAIADTTASPARIAQLEAEARALAKATGCSSASECRTAPVGATACGGPRTYIVYCAATTDSVALFRKLDELKAVETTYNKTSGMMSTCEYRLPPAVQAQGGMCREATPP